jgi:hypothetical protein
VLFPSITPDLFRGISCTALYDKLCTILCNVDTVLMYFDGMLKFEWLYLYAASHDGNYSNKTKMHDMNIMNI